MLKAEGWGRAATSTREGSRRRAHVSLPAGCALTDGLVVNVHAVARGDEVHVEGVALKRGTVGAAGLAQVLWPLDDTHEAEPEPRLEEGGRGGRTDGSFQSEEAEYGCGDGTEWVLYTKSGRPERAVTGLGSALDVMRGGAAERQRSNGQSSSGAA